MERTEVQRFDLVAQTEATGAILWRARIPITIVSALCIWLAATSTASPRETLAVRIFALLLVLTAIMLWTKSRYAACAMTILLFVILAGPWLLAENDPDTHTTLGRMSQYFISSVIFLIGYRWPSIAIPYIAGNAGSLQNERLQVEQWMRTLASPGYKDPVIEFSTKSFLKGYWTYRLLNTGAWWAIATFKTRNTERPLQLRVVEKNKVRANVGPDGSLNVELGNTLVTNVIAPSDVRQGLLNLCGSTESQD